MDKPTHDIDPDGEVIIVLCNADAPFAEWHEDSAPIELVQNHTQGIEASGNYGWKPAVTSEGKKKKRKKKDYKRSLEVLPEPVEEPVEETVEEPVEEPRETGVASEHSGSGRAASQDGLGEISDHDPAKQYNDEDLTERSYRIQVSAKHLELASSVFKKILRGGWKESVTYLQKGSVEITAESWDIEALLILLRVLHCRNSVVPRKLTLEMLAKVAVLADYYECKEAVGFFADTWIDALEKPPTTYCRDLILWLWVSWFFGLDDLFQEVTSTAMSLSTGWINNPGLPIPDRVFGMAETPNIDQPLMDF